MRCERLVENRRNRGRIRSDSIRETLPRSPLFGGRHSRRLRHRLGLHQSDLGDVGTHHLAGDMRVRFPAAGFMSANFTGAMAIALVTAVMGAVPMRLGVGVAVAVVTARGVEMVRLREERRRNDDKD